MSVQDPQNLTPDMIVAELEALIDWRSQVVRRGFFPSANGEAVDARPPSALADWHRKNAGGIDVKTADRFMFAYEDLAKASRLVLDGNKALSPELYDAFEHRFAGLVAQVRQLLQTVSGGAGTTDPVTGLRLPASLKADLRREQDRFDRKGTSYSIAHIAIDDHPGLKNTVEQKGRDALYASVAKVVSRTIRSFDDAYFLGDGEFIIILKHIDFMDACVVMDRLRAEISDTPVATPEGRRLNITASFGLSEAMQRESPDDALKSARDALSEAKQSGGNRVQEHRETSALAKYAKDVGNKGQP